MGIVIDASPKITGRKGGSEDILFMAMSDWTAKMEKDVARAEKDFEIFVPERVEWSEVQDTEVQPLTAT